MMRGNEEEPRLADGLAWRAARELEAGTPPPGGRGVAKWGWGRGTIHSISPPSSLWLYKIRFRPHPNFMDADVPSTGKTCTGCGVHYPNPSEGFYRHHGSVWRPRCKSCTKTKVVEWQGTNPEAAKASKARANKAWKARNPEKMKEARRRRRKSPAGRAAAKRAYRRNPAKYHAKNRASYARSAHMRALHSAKRSKRRALAASVGGSHSAGDIRRIYELQRGRCYWCRKPVKEYHVDHRVPLSRGGSNGPENLVVACASCNLRKGALTPEEFAGVLL